MDELVLDDFKDDTLSEVWHVGLTEGDGSIS